MLRGDTYDSKKDTYIIFICNFIPFEIDDYAYVAKYTCNTISTKENIEYDTGDYHYYFNLVTKTNLIPKDFRSLFEYFRNTTNYSRNIFTPEIIDDIDRKVKSIKTDPKIKEEYQMFAEKQKELEILAKNKGRAEGIVEGRTEERVENIKKFSQSLMGMGCDMSEIITNLIKIFPEYSEQEITKIISNQPI